MNSESPSYHREFMASPQHAVLGVLTLGLGIATAHPLGLIAGATAYLLGWIYVPDLGFFRRWVDHRRDQSVNAQELQKVAEFTQRREALRLSLSLERRSRYGRLAAVCRDIESAGADPAAAAPGSDPRLRKLDELMWTFLRLLSIEESLQRFVQSERDEDIPAAVRQAEEEVSRLQKELDALKAKGDSGVLETKQRFFSSRTERLEVLRKRQQRVEQAEANLALVLSEQERLEQQIKLIRADAVAAKNAETLTARIDATVEHLDQTNKWLSEMDEFKDLVGDMPNTELRLGYAIGQDASAVVPPVISSPDSTTPNRAAGKRALRN